jgi:hypothetical protein
MLKAKIIIDLIWECVFKEFSCVGHSLGAVAAFKNIWCNSRKTEGVQFTSLISLAGRLRYSSHKFLDFSKDVKETVEANFLAYEKSPGKCKLYSFRGNLDEIVPAKAAFIQSNSEQDISINSAGHSGIIYSKTVHEKISSILSV